MDPLICAVSDSGEMEAKMKREKKRLMLSSSLILISLVLLLLLTGCKVNSDKIDQPSYSVNEGTYTTPITVEINKPEGTDISIYYTIDGSDPTVNAIKYSEPITIATNTTLKSIAVSRDGLSSEIKLAVYTISVPSENIPDDQTPDQTNSSENIPDDQIPDETNDVNTDEKFMNTIQGTWISIQQGWTVTYSFTPTGLTSGTLIHSEIAPNGNGDGYTANYTITTTDGSNTGTINMKDVEDAGIMPDSTVLNIDFDSDKPNQIYINGILFTKNN